MRGQKVFVYSAFGGFYVRYVYICALMYGVYGFRRFLRLQGFGVLGSLGSY